MELAPHIKTLLQGAISPTAVISPDLRILQFNRAFLDLAQMRPREMQGKPLSEAFQIEGADLAQLIRANLDKKIYSPTTLREVGARSKKGEELVLTIQFLPALDEKTGMEYAILSMLDHTAEARTQSKYRQHLNLLNKSQRALADEAFKLSQLFTVSRSFAAILEIGPLIDRFVEAIMAILEADACSVAIWRHGEQEGSPHILRLKGFESRKKPEEEVRAGERNLWRKLLAGGAGVCWSAGKDLPPGFEMGDFPGPASIGAIVDVKNGSRGTVLLHKFRPAGRFFNKDLELLQTIVNQIAVSIHNADLYERLIDREKRLEESNVLLERRVADRTKEIELEKGKLDSILQNMGDGVLTVDAQGKIGFFNQALEGVAQSGGSYFDLFAPREGGDLPGGHPLLQVLAGSRPNARYAEKGANGRFYSVAATPLNELDGSRSAIVLLADVTEKREMEERLAQSEKLGALGELISGVAHELNNPLAAVVGFSELILRQEYNEKTPRFIEKIFTQAQRCKKIIENLLTFARKHKPERTLVALNEVAESVLELKAYELRIDDILVNKELNPALPWIEADFHQLQQVCLNLVNNAHQAMISNGRGGSLTIRTESTDAVVRLVIADDGPGIAQEHIGKIFDPFFTTKGVGEGTGLGLSLSFGIVREHGGEISVSSRPGEGATFTIELPRLKKEPAPRNEDAEESDEAAGAKILAIDDETSLLDLYEGMLDSMGHRPLTANSGMKALQILESEPNVDLIVCDLKMPGMDARGFYEELKRRHPELCRKICFATGDADPREFRPLLESAGRPLLAKPFSVKELSRFLKKSLELSGY